LTLFFFFFFFFPLRAQPGLQTAPAADLRRLPRFFLALLDSLFTPNWPLSRSKISHRRNFHQPSPRILSRQGIPSRIIDCPFITFLDDKSIPRGHLRGKTRGRGNPGTDGSFPSWNSHPPLLLDFDMETGLTVDGGPRRLTGLHFWRGGISHDRGYEKEINKLATPPLGMGGTRAPVLCFSLTYCVRMRPGACVVVAVRGFGNECANLPFVYSSLRQWWRFR